MAEQAQVSTPDASSTAAVAQQPSAGSPMSLSEFVSNDVPTGPDSDWFTDEIVEVSPEAGSGDEEQTTEDTTEQVASGDAQEQAGTEGSDSDDVIAKLARATGLDPNNPAHREALAAMAQNEGVRSKLASEQEAGEPDSELTELERSLLAEQPEEQQPVQTQQQQQTQAQQQTQTKTEPQPLRLGDIGDSWKSPEDGYKAEAAAWAEASETGDYSKLHEVRAAIAERQNRATLEKFVEQWLGPRLDQINQALQPVQKELLPRIQQEQAHHRFESAQAEVFDQLAAVPGVGADLVKEITAVQPGDEVEFRGSRFPNTVFNRIVAKNPGIAEIRILPNDPRLANVKPQDREATAQKYQFMLQAKEVIRKYREEKAGASLKPEIAKTLVDNGKKAAERQQQDRIRQRVNAGSGATGRDAKDDIHTAHVKDLARAGRSNSLELWDLH